MSNIKEYDPRKDDRYFMSECGVLALKDGFYDKDVITPEMMTHLLVLVEGEWRQPPMRARVIYELIYKNLMENVKIGKYYSDLSKEYIEWYIGASFIRSISFLSRYGFIVSTDAYKYNRARRYIPYNKAPTVDTGPLIDENNRVMYKFSKNWIIDPIEFKEFLTRKRFW